MPDHLILRRQDLIENPSPRVPVCLVLDCSPSMSGDPDWGSVVRQTNPRPIDELNEGVQTFFQSLMSDEVARYSAEVSIVAFSSMAECVLDFDSISRVDVPTLELEVEHGGTSIGKAVDLALTLLDKRKEEYQDAGVDYFQPWLVLMTDGQPTDDTHHAVARRVSQMVNSKKLTVFPIGIGRGADMGVLAQFSPGRTPLRLQGLKFSEFFEWLSQSISVVSQSMPGEKINLNVEDIKGWAEL
jgi:uncharacterized protein YegL